MSMVGSFAGGSPLWGNVSLGFGLSRGVVGTLPFGYNGSIDSPNQIDSYSTPGNCLTYGRAKNSVL